MGASQSKLNSLTAEQIADYVGKLGDGTVYAKCADAVLAFGVDGKALASIKSDEDFTKYLTELEIAGIRQQKLLSEWQAAKQQGNATKKPRQQQQQQQDVQTGSVQGARNISKPAFFTSYSDAWENYSSLSPSDAAKDTVFLNTITDAEVEVHTMQFNAENGAGAWPRRSGLEETALHVFKLGFPGHEEAMDDGMQLVKLPLEIPVGEVAVGSNAAGLFVRNEDVGLIKAWNSKRMRVDSTEVFRVRAAVVGNPGISKSWHLWKYLVMAANTQLWKAVAGDVPFPNQPEVIAFLFGEEEMKVYFLRDKIVHVFHDDFKKVLVALNEIANEEGKIRMLYEPAGSLNPIPHSNYAHPNIACTAAVSPRTIRYKEFLKQPAQLSKHIMPCPTWPEIVAMCSFIAYLNEENNDQKRENTLALIKRRFKNVGPFLRVLLSEDITKYMQDTTAAISKLSLEQLNEALKSIESDVGENATPPITHRFARYITPNSARGDFETAKLLPASEPVVRRIRSRLNELSTDKLRELLLNFENGISDTTENPKAYETLLSRYILEEGGLQWPYGHCDLTFDKRSPDPKARSLECLKVKCAKTKVSHESPLASDMASDVLYLPDDTSYPFVDMLWVDDDAKVQDPDSSKEDQHVESTMRIIFSAQNTTSNSHEKYLTVYEKLREQLGMPSAQLLVVYMAVLPKHVEGYLTGPVSTYFKGTSKRGRQGQQSFQFPSNIEFRVLLPDKEMRNRPPQDMDYKEALKKIYTPPARSSSRIQLATQSQQSLLQSKS